ncbi:MAG: hypothetical protein K0S12_2344, partial [Bacteroidetes bacterium]|nr:hypothetical protein [Bacteroidota bacterium]
RRMIAADIKEVITRIPFLSYSINSFLFGVKEEEDRKKIGFSFEIKEKISFLELGVIHSEISAKILLELENIDRHFTEIVRKLADTPTPDIRFFSFGDGPFKGITIHKKDQYYCKM